MSAWQSDLVVLVADGDMEFAIRGLLRRPQALPIRSLRVEIHRHLQRDPGCFLTAHDFLRPFASRSAHGLVLFDKQGCGREETSRESLEVVVENRLSAAGWGERAAAVALDPELEIWVWSDSPQVDRCLGWEGRRPPLRQWLRTEGLLSEGARKPHDPKTALRKALRAGGKGASAAIFEELASGVSLDRCADPAFLKLRRLLASWFPPHLPEVRRGC
jgi:hypothetical protein